MTNDIEYLFVGLLVIFMSFFVVCLLTFFFGSVFIGHCFITELYATSLSLFTFMHWRRKWQPTPVFLPGESQGQGSLVGCRLWGRTGSDMTEVT